MQSRETVEGVNSLRDSVAEMRESPSLSRGLDRIVERVRDSKLKFLIHSAREVFVALFALVVEKGIVGSSNAESDSRRRPLCIRP